MIKIELLKLKIPTSKVGNLLELEPETPTIISLSCFMYLDINLHLTVLF